MNRSDIKPFLKEALEQREKFVVFINSQEWNTPLRTECESLIIMYDQLLERYSDIVRPEKHTYEFKFSLEEFQVKEKPKNMLLRWFSYLKK